MQQYDCCLESKTNHMDINSVQNAVAHTRCTIKHSLLETQAHSVQSWLLGASISSPVHWTPQNWTIVQWKCFPANCFLESIVDVLTLMLKLCVLSASIQLPSCSTSASRSTSSTANSVETSSDATAWNREMKCTCKWNEMKSAINLLWGDILDVIWI